MQSDVHHCDSRRDTCPDLGPLAAHADKLEYRRISMSGSLKRRLWNGRQQHKDRPGTSWIVLTLDTVTRHIQWRIFGAKCADHEEVRMHPGIG